MNLGITSIFPEFRADILLQPRLLGLGVGIAHLLGKDIGVGLLKPKWRENEHVQRYYAMIINGGKKIAGPLLVVHGTTDD